MRGGAGRGCGAHLAHTFLAEAANLRVERVSSKQSAAGETVAMTKVLELPPNESCAKYQWCGGMVRDECLCGRCVGLYLEQECELGVSVVDVALLAACNVGECMDDIAESRQRPVDGASLWGGGQ